MSENNLPKEIVEKTEYDYYLEQVQGMQRLINTDLIIKLTGIQVSDEYKYELLELTLRDINISGYTEAIMKIMKKDRTVKSMVKRLLSGGALPAIVLNENMDIADGQHRVAAYLITKTTKFWALKKINRSRKVNSTNS